MSKKSDIDQLIFLLFKVNKSVLEDIDEWRRKSSGAFSREYIKCREEQQQKIELLIKLLVTLR